MRFFTLACAVFLGVGSAEPFHGQSTPPSGVVSAVPDGTQLALGDSCYRLTTTKNGVEQPVGNVFQSIQRQQVDGVDALAIVVHQHLSSGQFDMRDEFLLRRSDLRPIRLDTVRNGEPHVHLDYTLNHVTGWKMAKGNKEPIDIAFDGPVWDGNLWGVTFAALPLKTGASFQLPIYQYDSGKGMFYVSVKSQRQVATGRGAVFAWVLAAGVNPNELVEYLAGRDLLMELGYTAGPMSERVGGNCTNLK